MRKILVAVLAVSLLSLSATAVIDNGKKKARKKAKTEISKDNSCEPKNCDPKNCDPKNCDPKNCDPKNCQYPTAVKDEKCPATPACSGSK